MKTYSIKLIDGNRYEFTSNEQGITPIEQLRAGAKLLRVPESRTVTRYFVVSNIVSIEEVLN